MDDFADVNECWGIEMEMAYERWEAEQEYLEWEKQVEDEAYAKFIIPAYFEALAEFEG